MANSKQIQIENEAIARLMVLWTEYHEEYTALRGEYVLLIKAKAAKIKPSESLNRLRDSEYRCSECDFLHLEREDAEAALRRLRLNRLDRLSWHLHAGEIERWLTNLRTAVEQTRRFLKYYGAYKSPFGQDPDYCGRGRHKGGNSGPSES
jgi:hypothetical protein